MQFHDVKPNHPLRKARKVGRGGKKGTTSGRGTKGQKARAGHRIRPAERDLIKKIPKLRGAYFKSLQTKPSIVNVDALNESFADGQTVNPKTLFDAGLVSRVNGKIPDVKILGSGALKRKLTFSGVGFSGSSREKIKQSGGIIKEKQNA